MIKAEKQKGINPKGDCGPCCLSGITGKSVKEIYDIFNKIDGVSYFSMLDMVKKLGLIYNKKLPYLDEWRNDEEWQALGRPAYMLSKEWLENAYTKIHTGFVGLGQINIKGKAIEEEIIDHWIIIYKVEFKNEGIYKDNNIFISCPTKGEYTINVKKLLKNYGAYNVIWVKPIKN